MSTVSNLISQFAKIDRLQDRTEKARARFAARPFAESHARLWQVARGMQLALPLFSVFTGLFALAAALGSFVPFWLAAGLSLPLLALWERAKCLLLIKAFEQGLARQRLPLGLLPFAILFAAGSVYCSLEGVRQLSHRADRVAETVGQQFRQQRDSLHTVWQGRIEQARTDADSYFSANNYRGTLTWTPDGSISRHYRQLSEAVAGLEQQRDAALAELQRQEQAALLEGRQRFGRAGHAFLGVAVAIEVLIVLAGWFVVHYDWRVYREARLARAGMGPRITLTPEEARGFFDAHLLPQLLQFDGAATGSHSPAPIGFKRSATAATESLPQQQKTAKSAATAVADGTATDRAGAVAETAAADPSLIADIKAGVRDYRLLMNRYRVNVTTLHRLIETHGQS